VSSQDGYKQTEDLQIKLGSDRIGKEGDDSGMYCLEMRRRMSSLPLGTGRAVFIPRIPATRAKQFKLIIGRHFGNEYDI